MQIWSRNNVDNIILVGIAILIAMPKSQTDRFLPPAEFAADKVVGLSLFLVTEKSEREGTSFVQYE